MKQLNKKSRTVAVTIEKAVYDAIAALAHEEDRSVSLMIRRLVKEALKTRGVIGGEADE